MGRPGIRRRHRPPLAPSKARPGGHCKGLTLVELLTTLAVAGILVTAASGGATQLVQQHHAGAAVNQMLGAIRFARHAAVTHRASVTLCPASKARCGRRNTWHNGALVFLDRDANGRFDGSDVLLRRMPPLRDGDRVLLAFLPEQDLPHDQAQRADRLAERQHSLLPPGRRSEVRAADRHQRAGPRPARPGQ